jgi:hypothetical protein
MLCVLATAPCPDRVRPDSMTMTLTGIIMTVHQFIAYEAIISGASVALLHRDSTNCITLPEVLYSNAKSPTWTMMIHIHRVTIFIGSYCSTYKEIKNQDHCL